MTDIQKTRVVVRCRLSYTFVAEPKPDDEKKDDNGQPLYYYATQIIIPKSDKANRLKLNNAVKAAIAKKFGPDKVEAAMKNPNFKKPVRDADAESREGAEYQNAVFANSKTNAKGAADFQSRPGCALKNRTKLTSVADVAEHIYSGCYAYVSLTAYYFKSSGSQGIALALNNILKDEDGPRLDGSQDVMDEFDEMFEDDEFSGAATGASDNLGNFDDDDIGGFDDLDGDDGFGL